MGLYLTGSRNIFKSSLKALHQQSIALQFLNNCVHLLSDCLTCFNFITNWQGKHYHHSFIHVITDALRYSVTCCDSAASTGEVVPAPGGLRLQPAVLAGPRCAPSFQRPHLCSPQPPSVCPVLKRPLLASEPSASSLVIHKIGC